MGVRVEEESEKDDFVKRCARLSLVLESIRQTIEPSDRVWVMVMGEALRRICRGTKNPDASMEHLIAILQEEED
jgi:hypothetical protein